MFGNLMFGIVSLMNTIQTKVVDNQSVTTKQKNTCFKTQSKKGRETKEVVKRVKALSKRETLWI